MAWGRTCRCSHAFIGPEADRAEYRVAWDVYRLVGQLHLMANGATPIATPWNFARAECTQLPRVALHTGRESPRLAAKAGGYV